MRKTAVFRDPLFIAHDPGFDHVESPERLKVIYEALDRKEVRDHFIYPEFAPATHKIIGLNHTADLMKRVEKTAGKVFDSLDPDTFTSKQSYAAACKAVGALIHGVDLLLAKEIDNGFALVRPPGHHAEKDRSMGFCLFNNVAVAAHYALEHCGLKRVMIVDWDLHHGNGTQRSFYDSDKVLYVSTHQYPYYPGTGSLHETGQGKGEGYTVNIPLPGYQRDKEYAAIFNEIVFPLGKQYRPDLILISCGFDICQGDPLGAMEVTAKGFAYMTRSMVNLAKEVCSGKLLVTLEGGYNLNGMRDGALAVLSELCDQPLDSGSPTNLDKKSAECFANEKSVHPAIEQARFVAKRYWNL
ncbi:MAG: histone deacetylase [Proteobacteria bacterium]|nr:histone deacetylase [Pseudomonadota bacterium]MBU1420201.1 histone deacetylase [Pseudomonadota bacterium]MBU1455530.1 histone deacetylase [Pseudomonadota bacterium]